MKISIGRFDPATSTVPVTFEADGVVHSRRVNAVLDVAGKYDRAATAVRVDEVALGVAAKIACGALRPD